MKTLLWKDYRQNLRMLVAVGIFLLMPYVLSLTIAVVDRLRPVTHLPRYLMWSWSDYLMYASAWSLALLVVAGAFLASNALAGERADRSAEFSATLPIGRGQAVASKAILALSAFFAFAAANMLIAVIAGARVSAAVGRDLDAIVEVVPACAGMAVLIFGVAWLLSSLVRQPAIAAASGIAAAILLYGTLSIIDFLNHGGGAKPAQEHWFVTLNVGLGIAAFAAGVDCAVRRVEP